MSTPILVDLDGTLHDGRLPYLAADDLAAVRGDGVFETLLVVDGVACKVDRHLDRLARSARMLDLPAPDRAAWQRAVDVAVAAWGSVAGEGLLRLVYSRGRESAPELGPTAYVTVSAVPARISVARTEGVSVVTLERGFDSGFAARAPWQLLGAKTLSYATNMAALRHAGRLGYDDVLFTTADGQLLEGPRSTVVAVRDGALSTPPVDLGILPGTTQLAVFDLAEREGWKTEYTPMTPDDLFTADSVWLISSVTLAARVRAVDDRPLPNATSNVRSGDDPEGEPDFGDFVRRAVCSA